MMRLLFFTALCLGTVLLRGQSIGREHGLLLEANKAYTLGNYEKAKTLYEVALQENPSSLKANYNAGNALYRSSNYQEAARFYDAAAKTATDNFVKSKALYNLGNAHLQEGLSAEKQLEELIKSGNMQENMQKAEQLYKAQMGAFNQARDAYKNALRANPQDYDAKNNLAQVQRKIQQLQQQQQQQDQKQQEQKDNQNNQPPKNTEDGNTDNQKTNPIENNDRPKPNTPQDLSKDEVQRLMQIIENEDKKVQEKLLQQHQGNRPIPDKDW